MSYFEQWKKELSDVLVTIQESINSLCNTVANIFVYIGFVNVGEDSESRQDTKMSEITSEGVTESSPSTSYMSGSSENTEEKEKTISQRNLKESLDNSFENISDELFEII